MSGGATDVGRHLVIHLCEQEHILYGKGGVRPNHESLEQLEQENNSMELDKQFGRKNTEFML